MAPKHSISLAVGFFVIVVLGVGCFHKDVMTDTADDVLANLLYQDGEGDLIISKEEIFQASSKESGGGVTHISGHSEHRLSSYDISTGELIGRVELGEAMEEANALLGYSPGKIWMFSIDPELGLHYRNPRTLEVVEAWPQLKTKSGLSSFNPAHPDWPLISQYFVYDWELDRLLLTDEAGFKYELDPNTFEFKKSEAKINRVDWEKTILNSGGMFAKDDNIYLEGDPRKTITTFSKKSDPNLSFLFGQWIIDPSPINVAKRNQQEKHRLENAMKAAKDSIVAIETAHPQLKLPNEPFSWKDNDLRYRYEEFGRAVQNLQRNLERMDSYYDEVVDSPFLTSDGKSAYVFHANVVSDTAHVIVSSVRLGTDSTWTLNWSTDLPGIYHNTSTADQAGAFETVYSKGNPSFDYRWAACNDEYLVLISQLHMVGLNLQTGKLVWNIEI